MSSDEINHVIKAAADAVSQQLAGRPDPINMPSSILDTVMKAFAEPVRLAVSDTNAIGKHTLNGRLLSSSISSIFSPSGSYMIYLPANSPPSNGDHAWDVRIYSVEHRRDLLTLVAHRDVVMWAGYDPTEKIIGTVSWDKTSRLWDAQSGELMHTFQSNGQNWIGAFSPDSKMFVSTCGDGSIHIYTIDDGSEVCTIDHTQEWCRSLSWSPSSRLLAVGGAGFGMLFLIDVVAKEVKQERKLSASRSRTPEAFRRRLGSFMETGRVNFVDNGRKIVFWTSADASAEVLDLESGLKWRFARAGTQSYTEETTDEVPESQWGHGLTAWEDREQGVLKIATVDSDGIRVWQIALDSVEK